MKTTIKNLYILMLGSLMFTACSDFEEINIDPKAANIDQVQVEYIINQSIIAAQQDPHVAERAYVLYWKTASRQHRNNGALALGSYNEGWTNDYYNYLSDWLKNANLAISVADEKMENGTGADYTNNLKQVARIWRVYLMSEFTDNFGPMPVDAFSGVNPQFSDVQTVYYHMLDELREATSSFDLTIENPSNFDRYDQAYGFDYQKWIKYGNSLRLRLAMRLSEVDPQKAQQEFEAAAGGDLITASDDAFAVQEQSGWDALTGVMSREWNSQMLSATLNNLYIGLGGVSSEELLPARLHEAIQPADYIGLQWEEHLTTMTNDPSAGYWLDGLPAVIDPRAYEAFIIPGDFENPNFSYFPTYTEDATTVVRNLVDADGEVQVTFNGTYTWNAAALGNWGTKSARNQVSFYPGTTPRLSQRFRSSNSERIFFAAWETYFLIAEAAVRGWNTPVDGKTAYENGIRASFEYWGVDEFVDQYLQSDSYNRAGTSVNWDHTAEPPATVTMNYVNGYTNEPGTTTFTYPDNHLYLNGTVKNDLLTKVITQKYLAQLPWLPLEAWSDHRRLGLPFFENPAVDLPLTDLPNLNQSNYMTASVRNFPQRLEYPASLANSNPEGYQQAVSLLDGPDAVLTPLWWAKKE